MTLYVASHGSVVTAPSESEGYDAGSVRLIKIPDLLDLLKAHDMAFLAFETNSQEGRVLSKGIDVEWSPHGTRISLPKTPGTDYKALTASEPAIHRALRVLPTLVDLINQHEETHS